MAIENQAEHDQTEQLRRQLLALLSTPPQPDLHMTYGDKHSEYEAAGIPEY